MCRCNPNSAARLVFAALAATGVSGALLAQTAASAPEFAWKRVGGTTINRGLAGPSTGPVRTLWYNAAGNILRVQTASGRILETTDFQHWRLNSTGATAVLPRTSESTAVPEPGARVQQSGSRVYATGRANIYASDDSGRSWINLSGFNGKSILGDGFTALAVSPSDPKEITAANRFGVWRSLDGGLSWAGLNEELPNLPIRRLSARRIAVLDDDTQVVLDSGAWVPLAAAPAESVILNRARQSGLQFTAAAQSTSILYGGSTEGRLYTSLDNGANWVASQQTTAAPVERIWVDAERPQSALAAAGSRLYRTVNGGLFWDDVTGALPETVVHAVTADRSAGVIYAATDRGVMTANLSLNDAGPAAINWRSVNRNLPAARALDIRLNADNTLTVVLDGYGVFESQAPHRTRAVHLVNAADLSDRPAAPGSLVTILNASVSLAKSGTLAYPVIAASSLNSQLQVPFEATAGGYEIALDGAGDRWTVPLSIRDASPAIFVDSDGAPLILDSASSLVLDPNTAVRAGATVAIMATGLGRVSPEWPAGVPAPLDAPPSVVGQVTAFLDGVPVEVSRATLAPGYVGYYMVELRLPSIVNRGVADLRLVMNGDESNHVRLYLEP